MKLLTLLLITLTFSQTACSADRTYPKGGMIDSLWVSPAGDMALFMYSRYNIFPLIFENKPPLLTGKSLPGHHNSSNNPWNDSDLYFTYKTPEGQWSTPVNMPTNDSGADCCAMMAGTELFVQKGTDI
jgi:hypothetical protein